MPPAYACFLLGVLFNSEGGNDKYVIK
jgi:hypothetical protein